MPRRRRTPDAGQPVPTEQAPQPTPAVLDPHSVYTVAAATRALALKKTTLLREVRAGRLRVAERGGKYFFFGSWLREWLESAEVRKKPPIQLHDDEAGPAA